MTCFPSESIEQLCDQAQLEAVTIEGCWEQVQSTEYEPSILGTALCVFGATLVNLASQVETDLGFWAMVEAECPEESEVSARG